MGLIPIGWNKEWVKTKSKSEFVKAHLHLGDKEFLESEYDKIVPPKPKAVSSAGSKK